MAVQLRSEHADFDVSLWNQFRFDEDYSSIDLDVCPNCIPMSTPFDVFEFDFRRESILNMPKVVDEVGTNPVTMVDADGNKKSPAPPQKQFRDSLDLKIPMVRDGFVNGIVFWYELCLDEADPLNVVNTGPGLLSPAGQAFQSDLEVKMNRGELLPVKVSHNGVKLVFAVDNQQIPQFADKVSKVPLSNRFWMKSHADVKKFSEDLNRGVNNNTQVFEQTMETARMVSKDAGALDEYQVEPETASSFFLTFYS